MKFIGQFIQSLISRFRNDVYLEDVSSGTVASGGNLGLDSNNKIVKANEVSVSDADATTKGIVELATTAETTTGTDATRAVTPDGLKDGFQGSTNIVTLGSITTGVWRGSAIDQTYLIGQSGTNTGDQTTVSGNAGTATALATARDINGVSFDGTGDITVTAAGSTLSDTVTVAKGGTGATTLTDNAILTGTGTSAITAESTLAYTSETLTIGADDDGVSTIKRAAHSDDEGGDLYIRGGDAAGTDKSGGGVRLYGGRSTGDEAGGSIGIYSAPAGSSGSSVNGIYTSQAIALFKPDMSTTLGGNLIFEGSTPDAHETTFSITDPTADRTITVPNADVDLTKVRAASDTLDGVVELATTGEADTGTDTSRAVTPAGLKSHVDARYSYQYLNFTGNATTPADGDWMVPSGNGISNHLWNVNASNGSGGSSNGKTKDSSNITVAANSAGNGIIIPQACILVGFDALVRNGSRHTNHGSSAASSNYLDDQRSCGLFIGQPTYNDYAATGDLTLRCYAAQDNTGGPDTDWYLRITRATDMGNSISLSAGDVIVPAIAGTLSDGGHHSGGCIVSWTVVLKTLIP